MYTGGELFSFLLVRRSLQHIFEGLVKAFYQPIRLGVVWAGMNGIDMKEAVELLKELRLQISPLVCQQLLWNPNPLKDSHQFFSNCPCIDGSQWYRLRV